jgi:Mn2+/Fe2+ NRAMP family transporter
MQTEVESENIRFPEPPENLRGRRFNLVTALTFFGPGAIIASLTIGSGETVFATRVTALFGYAILWTAVLGLIAKAALVYASNRYISVTGEHPMHRFTTVFPGPKGWFPILMAAIAIPSFPAIASALSVGLGTYLEDLGWGGAQVWAIGVLVVTALLAFAGGYVWLERVQIAIVGLLVVLVIIAMFVTRPDWLGVLGGLVPNIPVYEPWVVQKYPDVAARPELVELVTFVGALGGGMYDYIGYSGLLREKRWGLLGHRDIDAIEDRISNLGRGERIPLSERPEDVRNARQWDRAPLGDVVISFVALGIFTIAFMVNGVTILNRQRQVPAEDKILTYQQQFLEAIAPIFRYFYIVAIILVFAGTIYALWEVYNRTTYESLGAVSERVRRAGAGRVRPWLYLYLGIVALLLVLTGLDLITLITPALIVGGTLAGGIYAAGLLYAERVTLPPQYRLRSVGYVLLVVAAIFLTIAGLVGLIDYLGIAPW